MAALAAWGAGAAAWSAADHAQGWGWLVVAWLAGCAVAAENLKRQQTEEALRKVE